MLASSYPQAECLSELMLVGFLYSKAFATALLVWVGGWGGVGGLGGKAHYNWDLGLAELGKKQIRFISCYQKSFFLGGFSIVPTTRYLLQPINEY